MSITNGYCTLNEFKQRFNIQSTDSNRDTDLEKFIETVSRLIDQHTGTEFFGTTETRKFTPEYDCRVWVDDFTAVTSITVDLNGDGTAEWTLTSTDYKLLKWDGHKSPYYGVEITPWATTIAGFAVGLLDSVVMAATWGNTATWAVDIVREACLLQSNRIYQRRNAPFGVTAPNEFGQQTVITRLDSDVVEMLSTVSRRSYT